MKSFVILRRLSVRCLEVIKPGCALLLVTGLLAGGSAAEAATRILAWDFNGENTVATSTAEVADANLSSSKELTRGATAAASAGANSFRTAGFLNNGIATSNTDYFQFVVSPAVGFKVSIATIDARYAGTATFRAAPGVSNQYAYSLDGTTFTLIGSPVLVTADGSAPQVDVSGVTELQNVQAGTTITFRYYASGQTTTGGWGYNSPSAGLYGLDIGGEVTTSGPVVDTNSYWDANGATPGAGGAAPAGIWGTDAFWSNSATGEAATVAWVAGGDAVFSAGTDATGSFTVTLAGTQNAGSVKFEEGSALLSGGVLDLADASPLLNVVGAQAEIGSNITGANGIVKAGVGKLILTGIKTFTGAVNVAAGTLEVATNGALGAADNDVLLNGTLRTTANLTLPATRDLTGGGSLAPAAGTTLEVLGNISTTALGIADVGTVEIKGATRSVGSLGFSAAGRVTGDALTATGFSTSFVSGTATVGNALALGAVARAVTVADAASTLVLQGDITLSNTLSKAGPGTLQLAGVNTGLTRLSIGTSGSAPVNGGTVSITHKNALSLGTNQVFFNYGVIHATVPLIGAEEIPNGLSMGGRDAAPVALTGSDMTFLGANTVFTSSGAGDIRLNVMNHTTFKGALPVGVSAANLTGFAIGGTGKLTLSGAMTGFRNALKLKDTVTVELDPLTDPLGDISTSASVAEPISLATGTTLTVGKVGSARAVTAYAGLTAVAGSVMKFDVGSAVAGTGHDTLTLMKPAATAAGAIAFAGQVKVDFIHDYVPLIGDSFKLLTWDASITPDFTGLTFSLPVLPDGRDWNTNSFVINGTISVIAESGADFSISQQPVSQQVFQGTDAAFSVTINGGTGPFSYQWRRGDVLLGVATASPSYTVISAQPGDMGNYFVDITNASGTLTGGPAVLTVLVPVAIDQQPAGKTVVVGGTATFDVVVSPLSSGPITYSWRKNGTPIASTNAASYTTPVTALPDNGALYDVVVTGPGTSNSVTSTAATLIVKEPGPIEITGNQTYEENLDSIGPAGTGYPNGWFGNDTDGTPGVSALLVSNGASNSGRLYNYGSTGASDRAIGSVASGTFLGAFGVSFTNLTGVTLEGSNVRLGFRSELWRSGQDAAAEVWAFEWKLGGDPASNEGYVRSTTFDIAEINPGATDGTAKDGNAEGNYVVLPATPFTALSGWEPGQILHIRWRDSNDPGGDAGMAIDDFSLTTTDVPPPPIPRYWDANGTLAGAGGASPAGTWGTDAFWGTLADGTSATDAWLPGADAIFSAGTDATGSFTVNVTGTHDIGALIFEEGTVTLTGGTLNFSDTQPTIQVLADGSATVGAVLTGSHGLLKRGPGVLKLTGQNLFTGNVLIAGGSVAISAANQLGVAENDIVLSGGGLVTTGSLDLGAERAISGGGFITVAAAETLTLHGPVTLSSLTLPSAGNIVFASTVNSLGALTLTAPTTLAGDKLALTTLNVTHAEGSSVIPNDLDLGSSIATVAVASGGTLELTGDLTLAGIGSNRFVKSGAGVLVLTGTNTAMNRLAIGNQGASTVDGGRVVFGNNQALGTSSVFFNYGTLEATVPMSGDHSLALGLSVAGRVGGVTMLTGSPMTFQQGLELYADAGPNTDIQLTVNNQTLVQGGITVNSLSLTRVTGFVVNGIGSFSFEGTVPSLSIPMVVKDQVLFELNTNYNLPAAAVISTVTLSEGTALAVGKDGGVREVTMYAGLTGAAGSEVRFDIEGTSRGAIEGGHDALILGTTTGGASGALSLHGKVKVSLTGGFVPFAGLSFDLLDWAAGVTPDFTGLTFDLPVLDATLAWNTSSFATDGTLSVIENSITIVDPPDSLQVLPGVPVTFAVVAEGPGVLTYQWRKGSDNIDGATSPSYTIPAVTAADQGDYTVVITSGSLSETSVPATLVVNEPVTSVAATRTPADEVLYTGTSVTFTALANGSGTRVYQWYKGLTMIEGATAATYSLGSLAIADTAADYHVRVSNGGAAVDSNLVALTVASAEPALETQPLPEFLLGVGQSLTLKVAATGRPPLKYQWKKDGKNVGGATASIYRVPAVTAVMGGIYTCEITNATGRLVSAESKVGVIQATPMVLNLGVGATATLKVTVSGPVTFDWTRDGGALPAAFVLSADKKTVTGKPLTIEHSGTYVIQASLGSLTKNGGTHVLKVFDTAPTSPANVVMPAGIVSGTYYYEMPIDQPSPGSPPRTAPSAYTAKGLPPGLKMDAKTGVITGKPTKASSTPYTVTMTASNKIGKTTTVGSLQVSDYPTKLAGVYAALIQPNVEINGDLGGRLDLTVTATGTYSGSVTLGTAKYPVKGAVDVSVTHEATPETTPAPGVKVSIQRKGNPVPLPLVLDVSLALNDATPVENKERLLNGTITDGTETSAAVGFRYLWDAKKGLAATAYLDAYTFGIGLPDADPEDLIGVASVPQGSGYGSFKVTPDGKLKIVGKTADGETLTCAAFIGPAGEVLVFQTLYTPVKGSIIGIPKITLGTTNPDNTLTGELEWYRPENTTKTTRTYRAGFDPITVTVSGGRYVLPGAGKVAFDLTSGSQADVTFSEGGISLDGAARADIRVGIGDKNKITVVSATNPSLTTLKSVNSATGAFSGSFTLVDANLIAPTPPTFKRTVTFQGLIIREAGQYVGIGYFLLPQRPTPIVPATTMATAPILSGQVSILPVVLP